VVSTRESESPLEVAIDIFATLTQSRRGKKARLASLFDILRHRGWEPGRAAGWDAAATLESYQNLIGGGTSSKNLPLACVSVELLVQHKPDTVRGNMYRVVSAGWLPDTSKPSYNRIQRLLNRLRIKRQIPFEWIVDNVRSTIKPSSWSGLEDFTETVAHAYRKDFWAQLPEYVEVIVEKDTVAGTLAPVTQEFDVRLHPIRGYNSTTFAWDIAKFWNRIDKPIFIYYIGDHDPSGRDLERDIREKVASFTDKEITWTRLAVNAEHFAEFSIRPLEPKKKDKRTPKFIERFGRACAEVEAIPASDLRRMLREAIEQHIPVAQWQRLQEVERLEKASFQQALKALRGGLVV